MNKTFQFFATTPKGLELLLVEELKALGAVDAKEKLAGVTFSGSLALAYKACLWSRLANRVLLSLTKIPAKTPEALYQGIQTIRWADHINPQGTLAVHFVTSQSTISHDLFGAQKVKDAIVDQLREQFGVRPNVAREQPDVRVHVYLYRDQATISIDLSGESLHRRGYRLKTGPAPLKENLAAAILLRAGWPEIARLGGVLLDPMCGSGTLLIEGAFMAYNIAPGLLRSYYGFLGWKKHDAILWQSLLDEARRSQQSPPETLEIIGYDHHPLAIKAAFEHIELANLRGKIHVEKRDVTSFAKNPKYSYGLVVTNPPYGERLGEEETLKPLYRTLGAQLKQTFVGFHAAVFTGNPTLGKEMGLRAKRYYALYNGAILCKLLLFDVQTEYFVDRSPERDNERRIQAAQKAIETGGDQSIQMLANRLRKNLKHLGRRAKRMGVTAYRVYDADLPEYAFAIDLSAEGLHIAEYEAPRSANQTKVLKRRNQTLSILPEIFNLPAKQIFYSLIPRLS